jgi:ribosome maturation factor RimP
VRKSDFERYTGHVAKIETSLPIQGRKRFRGVLAGTEGENARIQRVAEGEETEILIPIEEMSEAKLVLTDELVTEALRREKSAKREAREARKETRREERQSRHRPHRPAAKGGE